MTHRRTHTEDELARDFTLCTLPKSEWTHSCHLRVGAWHVDALGQERALAVLRAGIRRLNESHGVANTPDGGYHETITRAYVQLIAAFFATLPAELPLAERTERLVNGPLGARDVLFRFWTRELLLSSGARATWVPPDVMPLELGSVLG